MVAIGVRSDSSKVTMFSHGVTIPERFKIKEGVWLDPSVPALNLEAATAGSPGFTDYAAAVYGADIASFILVVEHPDDGEALATEAWNALWLLHLLGIACRSPCTFLYAMSDGKKPLYSAVGRSPFVKPVEQIHPATIEELTWARSHVEKFYLLLNVPEFNYGVRCFGNSVYLFDLDAQIMLLWAGIEGLLSVDSELSRRLALYAALIIDGTPDEKAEYFKTVREAYKIRSLAVHGGRTKTTRERLAEGHRKATRILTDLLARCIELGRVPSPAELDFLAISATVK